MLRTKFAQIVSVLLLLTGCKTATVSSTETPAMIKVHSPDSIAELRATIRKVFNDRDILIATTAFTKSSRLVISRKPIKGPGGRVIEPQEPIEPIVFQLVLQDSRCYLIDTRNDARYELKQAKCESTIN